MKPKFLDFIALLISLLVLGGVSLYAYQKPGDRSLLWLKNENSEWVYPLESAEEYTLSGPLGDTVIQVSAGTVRVLSSPCPEQICVRHAPISRSGEWIACLPNQVLARIQAGQAKEAPDAASF